MNCSLLLVLLIFITYFKPLQVVTSGSSIIDYELCFGFIQYEICGELGVEIFWVFGLGFSQE